MTKLPTMHVPMAVLLALVMLNAPHLLFSVPPNPFFDFEVDALPIVQAPDPKSICPRCPDRDSEISVLRDEISNLRKDFFDAGQVLKEIDALRRENDSLKERILLLEQRPIPTGCEGTTFFGLKTPCRLLYPSIPPPEQEP
jgi:hypothetical protein